MPFVLQFQKSKTYIITCNCWNSCLWTVAKKNVDPLGFRDLIPFENNLSYFLSKPIFQKPVIPGPRSVVNIFLCTFVEGLVQITVSISPFWILCFCTYTFYHGVEARIRKNWLWDLTDDIGQSSEDWWSSWFGAVVQMRKVVWYSQIRIAITDP